MRYALLDGPMVVNVIIWDGDAPFETAAETVALPDDSPVGIGWTRDGDDWIAPPEPEEPEETP